MNIHRIVNVRPSRPTGLTARLLAWIVLAVMLLPRALPAQQSLDPPKNSAQPVSFDVQIDKPEAQVAERIQLEIKATAPQEITVKFPELAEQLGEFEVTSVNDTLDIPAGENRIWIRRIGLESLVSGELEIPGIEVSYIDRRGATPSAGLQTTPVQHVMIRSTLEGVEDPSQFRDIKSVVFAPETPPANQGWLIAAALASGIGLIAALVFVAVRRKSVPSPKQWAIKSLHELRQSQALRDKNIEQVYVRLVSILRTFVDWQFGISAPRLTTDEFLRAMQSDDRLTVEFRGELSELLNLADLVKFAGMLPDSDQLTDVVDQAVQLIENTTETGTRVIRPGGVTINTSTQARKFQHTAEDN